MSKSSYRAILMRTLLVLFFTAIALTLRWRAVQMLPVDYDEDDYLRAGQEFAQKIGLVFWKQITASNTLHLQRFFMDLACSPFPRQRLSKTNQQRLPQTKHCQRI